MKEVFISKDQYIKFEADMIKNSGIQVFQPFTESTNLNEDLIILKYPIKTSHKTVTELKEMGFYQPEQLLNFMKSINTLETLCNHYLLEIEHIDFNPAFIYYDMQSQEYIWPYVPNKTSKSNFKRLDLVRDLLIETYHNQSEAFFRYLPSKHFNIEEITNIIYSKMNETTPQTHFFQRFVKRKSAQISDLPRQTTVHNPTYPILLNKSDPSESYKLYFELNTIGRDESCNIWVRDQSISRKHAIVYRENQQYKVKDLSSTNGTLLNNQPITGDVTIVNGDKLQIGEKEFIFIR